ncbi:DUF4292 domain-containing protein [Chitinophaga horti]|uniref:DUF4292 domain-containing protein n=1 Tax=Chitinophaga horti TaxID=2920382 RepID=A0ABY6IY22_9BACT|nr:DUF4292 domain-containing protein [Chitinophaga horti]UYQ92286.1 DUF4292 domain-containing protein [Chitinophaga horti]
MRRTVLLQSIVAILSLALLSCGSAKKITRASFPSDTTGVVKKDSSAATNEADRALAAGIVEKMKANHIDFKTFEAKLKVDYANDKGTSFNNIRVNIRMIKDSVIWISASVLILDDVVRCMITKDSLKLVNRKDKTVMLRDIAQARETLNIPFDFNTLQDLLVGNAIYFNDSISNIVKTNSVVSFTCQHPELVSLFNVFADDFGLQQSKVTDKDAAGRSCELTYGEYKNVQGRKFPTQRRIYIEEKNILKIAMDFKDKIEFDSPVSIPFRVPANYTKE